MAGSFQENLPDPQRVYAPYGGGGSEGTGAAISGAVSGLAGIAGAFFQKQGQEDRAEQGNALDKGISDIVLDKASAAPPALVGQPTGNPTQDAGAASPTGKQLGSDLDRISQASDQGSMSEMEKLTRINTLVQDAVNKDPLHADYYRSLAKETLGVTPVAKIFELQNQNAEFEKTVSQNVYHTNVMGAANAGITILKTDGTPDLQAMAAAGAKVLQSDKDTEQKLKEYQLATAAAGAKPPHEDMVSGEVNVAMGGLNPVLSEVHSSLLGNLPTRISQLASKGNDAAIQQLGVDLNNQQAQTMNYVDGFIIQHNISPEAAGKIRGEVRSMFDDYRNLFGDPKAPLDSIAANARTLKDAQTKGQINFRQAMPTAARVKDVVGDQGIAALFAQNSILAPDVNNQLQTETQNFLHGKPTMTDAANASVSAMTGSYDVSKEQRPQWQSAVTGGMVRTVNELVKTPDKLNPNQQSAFGHSMVQISNVALNDKSPANLENAASIVNNPAAIRTFQNYAKNDANSGNTPIVALGMNSLLYQHVVSARRTLQQGQDISLALPSTIPQNVTGQGIRTGSGINQSINVHAGAVYNPQSGQVEFQMTGTDSSGKIVTLSPQQQTEGLKSFGQYRNSVTQVNRSLDAMTVLKDYTHDGTDSLKPLEVKGLAAQSAGIPIKNGMTIPRPSGATPSSSTSLSGDSGGFVGGVRKLEGGNQGQSNPRSSASGVGQFIKGTWLSLAKQTFPDEVKGLNDTQILGLRNDAKPGGFADRMIEAYKMQNASKLHAAGIDNPDDAELYMAHHFGPEGAIQIMNAPLRKPIEEILPDSVIKVNPDLKGMTPLKLYKKYSQVFQPSAG